MKKIFFISSMLVLNQLAFATNTAQNNSHLLLWLGLILAIAMLALLINKLGQPAVLGQILAGVLISI
ncbi:MAG: hypothetical protein ACK4M7_06045, partial [Burkholderiales bacterium]